MERRRGGVKGIGIGKIGHILRLCITLYTLALHPQTDGVQRWGMCEGMGGGEGWMKERGESRMKRVRRRMACIQVCGFSSLF